MRLLKVVRRFLAERKSDVEEFGRKAISPIRKRKLNEAFCIISNNCWGGKVYQRYGYSYNSPTVGLYFFADDYIRFLKDIKRYLNTTLEIIPAEKSRYYDLLVKQGQTSVPIGRIDDVEIVFLHYKTAEEALEKWERRKRRVDYNNLIVKFSRMNGCTDEHLKAFDELPFSTKFVFNNKQNPEVKSSVYIPGYDCSDQISDDTSKYSSYIDLVRLINNREIVNKNE